MDTTGELYRVTSSRLGNSSRWRDMSDRDIFSSTSRKDVNDEEEDEALMWAALEKLPTYTRARKGILMEADGKAREIDVDKLGMKEKKELLERLVKIAENDHERFLLKLRDRIDRVGITIPTIEVRFEHLSIDAEVYVGTRALPSVFNFVLNLVEAALNWLHILASRKQPLSILHDVSGIIRPGRMMLLLGPPSSGKTTLLLVLADKLDKDLKYSGKITYNGHTMDEFVPRRTSAYISQNDLHTGALTVRETLAFSARFQGVGTNYDMLVELARREKEANIKPDRDIDIYMKAAAIEGQEASIVTEYIIKILGLDICADTFVGNDMIRGISGGQKKRLTTGRYRIVALLRLYRMIARKLPCDDGWSQQT